jgi:hypothetical protein
LFALVGNPALFHCEEGVQPTDEAIHRVSEDAVREVRFAFYEPID